MYTQEVVTAQAYRAVIEDRIHELWKDRTWYRNHPGWIVQQEMESRAELRLLVGLARKARSLARPAIQIENYTARDSVFMPMFEGMDSYSEPELREMFGK